MGSVTTITKLICKEKSIATQDIESLFGHFEMMQDEALRSPARLPKSLDDKSISSIHRVSVRIYYLPRIGSK
jgi:hypothetical protein